MNKPWWCYSIASQSELLNKTLAYSVCHTKIIVQNSPGSSFCFVFIPSSPDFLNKTRTQQNLSFLAKEAKPSDATMQPETLNYCYSTKLMMYNLLARITKILKKVAYCRYA